MMVNAEVDILHELDEFLAQNWEMIKVQDIDDGLRENHNIDVHILVSLAVASVYRDEPG